MGIIKVLKCIFFIVVLSCNSLLFAQTWPADTISVEINSGDPAYPFPQFLEYDYGKSLAANNAEGVTHADMEKSMREAYIIMMHRTIYSGEVLDGQQYMVFNPGVVPKNNNTFVSEGDGYALLAAAYMGDKKTFDGLWLWIHDNRLSQVKRYLDCVDLRPAYRFGNNLPGWLNDETTTDFDGSNDSATDGDYDIAMGLLLAFKQWGENSGITSSCGQQINYKDEALLMIKAIVDTVGIDDGSGAAERFISGDIGVDGYCKNGNTWGEVSNWRYNALLNTAYPWAIDAPNTFGSPGNVAVYTDYIGPAYFRQFGDFLQTNGGTPWQIDQYRRGEASSDWMMGEMFNKGFIASSGKCTVNDDGSVTAFGNHPSGADGEDFRAAWRTILNYVWHGNPTTTWNPVTHQVDNVGNTFEYDIGLKHAANLKQPGINAGAAECSTLGASPDPSCPNFSGPAHIPQLWGQDGSINSQYRTNYNVGVGGVAAVASEDLELLGDIYRQSEILWDDVSAMSSGLTDDERYIKSTPNYFHGWFRLLGMLTTSGNLHSPDKFEAEANLKIYMSVDKTFAFSGDIVTYTIDYRNYGSVDATGTTISLPIPPEYAFLTASDGGVVNGTNLEWNIGTVPGFKSTTGVNPTKGQVTFTVQVNPLPTATRVCLESTISANNAPDWVSNEFPNNASYTMERNCVDLLAQRNLKINKSTNRSVMNTGDIVSFYVDFENESSGDAWLNGGRSEVVVSYGNYAPGSAYNFYQFYRFWHDASEAYINMSNYRVSYYMNDAAAVGLYDGTTNPTGWTFSVDNQSDLDKYGYNPTTGGIDFTYQEVPAGSDADGSWNQRLIVQFADVLTAPASHIYDKLDSDYLIHKGVTGPGFIRTALASNPPDALNARIMDDWSYEGTLDVGQVAAQNERFTPITNNWADYNNLNIPVTNYSRYVCDPDVDNYDRVLVEEFDGYTWRRLSGRGPLPGREVEFVVIRDTIPLELDWFGFTDDEALGVNAIYTPSPDPATDGFTGIVTWEIPALLVGQSGDFEYQAVAGQITCPGADIEFENAAWIESSTDSPDSSKVDLTLTCVSQPAVLDPQNSLVKTANKTAVSVGDAITYTLTYENNDGSIVESDFSDASDWQALGSGALPDFGGSTISLDQNSNSNSPGTSGYAFGHTKSHGKNGYIETVWDLNNGGLTSFVLRHTAGTPGQADFQGIRVEMEPRPWGANTVNVKVYNNTTEVYTSGTSPIAHGGAASPVNIKVEVIDDEVFIYFNNPDGVPLISVDGLTNLDAGYVGIQSGSVTNEIISFKTHFDSAFDLDFYDPIVSDLTGVNTISNSGVINAGTVEWPTVNGPILEGEVLTRTFNAEVASCNTFLANIGYADVYGVDSLASLYSVTCDGVTTCIQPTGVTLTMDPIGGEICEGETIELTASATGGVFEYEFRDGSGVVQAASTSTTFITNAAEDYTVVVTDPSDALGCNETSDAVTVVVNPIPSVTLGPDATYCPEELATATLTVTPSGGNAPYVVTYTTPSSTTGTVTVTGLTGDISGLESGVYTVTDIADGKCSQAITGETATISVNPILEISDTVVVCDYATQMATVTGLISGGEGSYTVTGTPNNGALLGGDFSSTFLADGNTSYTFDFGDATSCVGNTVQISNEIDCSCPVTGALSLSSGNTLAICEGETTQVEVLASNSNEGSAVYSVTLTDETPTIHTSVSDDGTLFLFELSAAGTYTIATVSDQGCDGLGSGSIEVTVTDTIAPTTTGVTYCLGETAVALTATAAGTLTWYTDNLPATTGVTTAPIPSTTVVGSTSYYVSNTVNGCESGRTELVVAVNGLPGVTATALPTAICLGESTTLTGGGADTYIWNNGVTDGVAVSPSTTTTYQVIGTDGNGCVDSITVEVVVNSLPLVTGTALPTAICLGESTTLTGGGADTYTWNIGVTDGVAVSPTINTTYQVKGTDVNGCVDSVTVDVIVNELPTASIELGSTLCQETLATEGLTVTIVGGTADYTIGYTDPNGAITSPAITGLTYDITPLLVGDYTLNSVTDDNGCTTTGINETVSIEVHTDLLMIDPMVVCDFVTKEATVTGTLTEGVPAGYVLFDQLPLGSGGLAPVGDFSATFLAVGETPYEYTFSDGTGCENNTDTATVTGTVNCDCPVVGTLDFATGFDGEICVGDSTIVEVTASGSVEAMPIYTVTLTNGGGSITPTTVSADGTVFTFELQSAGSYTIESIADQSCTGSGSGTVTVNITDPLAPVVLPIAYCLGAPSVALTATGTNLQWYDTDGTTGLASSPIPSTLIAGAPALSYFVTQTVNSCESPQAQLDVEVYGLPTITATATPQTLCIGDSTNLTGGVATITYTWNDFIADGGIRKPITTTTYTVTGTDGNNCVDSATVEVTVNALPILSPIATPAELCLGDVTTLEGVGANTYVWDNGVVDNTPFSPTGTTTYQVTGTDANGCIDSTTLEVIVNELPSATIGSSDTFCTEDLGTEALTVTIVGGAADYDVEYVTPQSITTIETTTTTQLLINPLEVGDYRLVSVTDGNGCIATIDTTVVIGAYADLLIIDPLVVCDFDTKEATVTGTLVDGVPADYTLIDQLPVGSGTLTTASFSGTFLAIGDTPYAYNLSDSTGCDNNTVLLDGSVNCDCPVSGTISGGGDICPGDMTQVEVLVEGSDQTSGDYTVRITDGTNTATQTITGIALGATHTFVFDVASAGTYQIDSISDQSCRGSGSGSAIVTMLDTTSFTLNVDASPINLCPTNALNLQALATGENVSYQWYLNTVAIAGATNNTYDVPSVTSLDAGTYYVIASGDCGDTTSAAVAVTIGTATSIGQDLLTDTITLCEGLPLDLEIEALGDNLMYAWTKGGSTTEALSIASVGLSDAGDYGVTVTGACGTEVTAITPVVVNASTVITVPPTLLDADLCPTEELRLSVAATGVDLSYQWTKDGVDLLVAIEEEFVIPSVDALDAGVYGVTVTGACGVVLSTTVNVTIGTETEITLPSVDASICELSTASFAVTAIGDGLTYEWFKDEVMLSGTAASHTVTNAQLSDEGNYKVVVTGECGLDSSVAVLTITDVETPTISLTPTLTVCQGDIVEFTASQTAGGDNPLYTFTNAVTTEELQAESAINTMTRVIGEDITVQVSMLSNSACIDPGAPNPVTAEATVTIVEPATAEIILPVVASNTYYTAEDDVAGVTSENTAGTGAYSQEWTIVYGQGAIVSPSAVATDVTGLEIIDDITALVVEIQDVAKLCPSATDTLFINRKDITVPEDTVVVYCEDDLPQMIIGVEPIAGIETASIIDNDGIAGGGTISGRELTIVSGTTPGAYNTTYQIDNSVSNTSLTANWDITIHGLPTPADAGNDTTTCTDEISLTGNTPIIGTGSWSCDGGMLSDATNPTAQLSNLLPNTTITCIWTTSNETCPETTDEVTITKQGDMTSPVISIDGTEVTGETLDICITDTPSLEGRSPIAGNGETAEWMSTNPLAVADVTGTTPVYGALTLVDAGVSEITWTISSNVPGCNPATGTITLNVHAEPVADIVAITANDTCANVDEITVETAALGVTDNGNWISTLVPTGTIPNWDIQGTALSVGTNQITWEVDNAGCDPVQDDTVITIEANVTPTIALLLKPTLCVGADAPYTAMVTNEGIGATYTWQFENEASETNNSTSYILNDVSESGTLTVMMRSGERCATPIEVSTTTELSVVPGPSPLLTIELDSIICVTSPIIIGATDTTGSITTTYQWMRDGDAIGGETATIESLPNVSTDGVYTLVADNGVCTPIESSNNLILDVRQVPIVDASANGIDPIEVQEGDEVILSGDVINETGTTTILWESTTLDGSIINPQDLNSGIATEENGGEHILKLTAQDGSCEAEDVVTVNIRSILQVPNVFTVNGDGENDKFEIKGIESYPKAKIYIFNRWGSEVYSKLGSYYGNEWDGGDLPEGVYYYLINYGEGFGKNGTGCVHLLR